MTSDWMFWIAGGVLGIAGLWLAYWALLSDRAKGRKRCPKCWYDMQGAKSLRCPECGHTAKGERKLRKTRRRWRWALLSVVLFLGATSLGLTPRVREGGLASILPTTGLILVQRYRDDLWAYEAVLSRIRVKRPDGSVDHPRSKLYAWQWRMLASTCLQNIQEAEEGYLEEEAFAVLAITSRSGIEPPSDAGAIFAECIKNPPAWGTIDLRRLRDNDLGPWLADQTEMIDDAALARLCQASEADEAYRLVNLLGSRGDEDHLVQELLRIIPQMKDASCVGEVFEPVISYLFRAAWSGRKADQRTINTLITILSARLAPARYNAALLLASPEVVDSQLALRSLELAIDSGDPDDDPRMVRTTVSLIKALEEEGHTDESDSENPAVAARFLIAVASVDFDMAMFVIRRDLEGAYPSHTELMIDALVSQTKQIEVTLRILARLAHDDEPAIRRMVPSRIAQLGPGAIKAIPILLTLRDDTSEEVRSDAERALERIRSGGE